MPWPVLQLGRSRYFGHPWRLFLTTVKTVFVAHVFMDYFYSVATLEGPSMLPTFEVHGDTAIISKWYRRGRYVKVGDLVSFDSVVDPRGRVIKRVIGLEG